MTAWSKVWVLATRIQCSWVRTQSKHGCNSVSLWCCPVWEETFAMGWQTQTDAETHTDTEREGQKHKTDATCTKLHKHKDRTHLETHTETGTHCIQRNIHRGTDQLKPRRERQTWADEAYITALTCLQYVVHGQVSCNWEWNISDTWVLTLKSLLHTGVGRKHC
jgi:hypothetical protein